MNSVLSAFSPVRNLKRLFQRPEGHYPVLDGLRALSILMIIVFHTCSIYCTLAPGLKLMDMIEGSGWAIWVWNSDKSVDVFFVISGFLITGILLREIKAHGRIRLGLFYLRRFLRLSPAYWVVLAVYVVCGLGNSDKIWANILYVNNFLPYGQQAMNWTWTLAIEEQFYLLYPLILMTLMVKMERPMRWLWGMFGLSFVVIFFIIMSDEKIRTTPLSMFVMDMKFHDHYFSVVYDNFYTRYGALMCGCIASAYHILHRERLSAFLDSATGKILGFVSFVVIVLIMGFPMMNRCYDSYQPLSIFYQTISRNAFSGAVAYLALASIENRTFSRLFQVFFSLKFWYPLSQLSYSMYLWHLFPIVILIKTAVHSMAVNPAGFSGSHWAAMGILSTYSTIITILGAAIVYLLVERPIMNLRSGS